MSDKVVFVLEVDDAGFAVKMRSAEQTLMRLSSSGRGAAAGLNTTSRSLENIDRAVTGSIAKLRDFAQISSGIHSIILGLRASIFDWQGSIISANSELERMTVLMAGFSKASNFTDAMKEGEAGAEAMIQIAKSAPFGLKEIADSAVKLKSGGIDPLNGSLTALINSVANFGGTSDQFHRATIAIQQMAGKGTISMEEMRQQLGEAVPSALQALARATGMSMALLTKEISKGALQSAGTLDKLLTEMGREFDGSAARLMNTWSGMVSLMQTELMLFFKQVGDAGYMDALRSAVSDITTTLASADGKRFATELGKGLATVVNMAHEAALFIRENFDAISNAVKLLAEVWLASKLVGALLAVRAAMVSTFAPAMLSIVTSISTAIMGMVSVLRGGAISMAAVGAAAKAMWRAVLGPIGLALIGIEAAMLLFDKLGNSADSAAGKVNDLARAHKNYIDALRANPNLTYDDEVMSGARNEMASAAKERAANLQEIANLQNEIARIGKRSTFGKVTVAGPGGAKTIEYTQEMKAADLKAAQDRIGTLQKTNEDLQKRMIEGELALNRAMTVQIEANADAQKDGQMRYYAASTREITSKYNEERRKLYDSFIATEKRGQKRTEQEQQEYNQRLSDLYQAETDERLQKMDELIRGFTAKDDEFKKKAESGNAADKQALQQHTATVQKLLEERAKIAGEGAQAVANALQKVNLLDMGAGDKTVEKQKKLFDRLKAQYVGHVEEMKAVADTPGTSGFFEKTLVYLQLLERQGKVTGAQFQELRGLINEVDIGEASKKVDALARDLERAQAAIDSRLEGKSTREGRLGEQVDEARALAEKKLQDAQKIGNERGIAQAQALLDKTRELTAAYDEQYVPKERLLEQDQRVRAEVNSMGNQMHNEALRIQEDMATLGMNSADQLRYELENRSKMYRDYLDSLQMSDEERVRRMNQLQEWQVGMQQRIAYETQPALIRQLTQMGSITQQLDNATTSWLDGGLDALERFADGGKDAFKQFAESVLRDVQRMILKMLILQAIQSAIGFGGGLSFGGGVEDVAMGLGAPVPVAPQKNGGVLAPGGYIPNAFGNVLTKAQFDRGGIATKPTWALMAEADMNEAFVPLPDGRTIPVTLNSPAAQASPNQTALTVNLINESGTPLEAEQGQQNFDGERWVLDVVMRGAKRPGEFRDVMRSI